MSRSRKKDEYDKWRKEIEEERRQKIAAETPEPEDTLELENIQKPSEHQQPTGVYNPKPQRPIREPSFGQELSSVFSYPFYGEGRSLMIAGTLFISIIYFLNTSFVLFSILFTFLKFFLVFYLSAFMFKIIVHSSSGEDELPDWPDIVRLFWRPSEAFFLSNIHHSYQFFTYGNILLFLQRTFVCRSYLFINLNLGSILPSDGPHCGCYVWYTFSAKPHGYPSIYKKNYF